MPDKNIRRQIDWAAQRLAAAERAACMTGAGVSAESGVPTFRGAGGLWEGRRAEDLATPEAFAADPATVWGFYRMRREALLGVQPNAAHRALAELEGLCPRFDLITQNVDGLHRRAGSNRLICLHGDIWIDRCTKCGLETRVTQVSQALPACPACGALARPGVVWFGEMLPAGALQDAAQAASKARIMLVIGTSSAVQPAASLASLTKDAGGTLVEVNIERTPLSDEADVTLLGKAGEIVPRIVAAVRALRGSGPQPQRL